MGQQEPNITCMGALRQLALQADTDCVRHLGPNCARGQYRSDFWAHGHGQRAHSPEIGAVHVVAHQKHTGANQATFNGKDVALTSAPHIKELINVPSVGNGSNIATAFYGAWRAVRDLMVSDKNNLLWCGNPPIAQAAQLLVCGLNKPVMDDEHLRIRIDDFTRGDPVSVAGTCKHFLSGGHGPYCWRRVLLYSFFHRCTFQMRY